MKELLLALKQADTSANEEKVFDLLNKGITLIKNEYDEDLCFQFFEFAKEYDHLPSARLSIEQILQLNLTAEKRRFYLTKLTYFIANHDPKHCWCCVNNQFEEQLSESIKWAEQLDPLLPEGEYSWYVDSSMLTSLLLQSAREGHSANFNRIRHRITKAMHWLEHDNRVPEHLQMENLLHECRLDLAETYVLEGTNASVAVKLIEDYIKYAESSKMANYEMDRAYQLLDKLIGK